MVQINSINSTANSFSFDLVTSSGDQISLSIYDNKQLEYKISKNSDSKNISLNLKHELGYKFSYKGNGIDAKDQKEIEKAMKIIKPIYKKFLQNVEKSNQTLNNTHIINTSTIIKNYLPKVNDQDFLKNKTIDTMDEILKEFEKNDKLIEETKKLFDKLFNNIDKFEFYF